MLVDSCISSNNWYYKFVNKKQEILFTSDY